MNRLLSACVMLLAFTWGVNAADWYSQRTERFRGDQWRPHIFDQVRTDLDHVRSGKASDKERTRLKTTEGELAKMQADLDQGRWDNGILNDVIDSVEKSSNDDNLAPRDRTVLADDLSRLKEFQNQHNHH